MNHSAPTADVLLFQCRSCGTELSVPLAMQGVTGPCPCCAQQIQAPQTQARPIFLPPLDGLHEALTAPVPAPLLPWEQPAVEEPGPDQSFRSGITASLLPKQLSAHESLGFQAKLSIPQSEEPLDHSWKERHLDNRRRLGAARRIDRATESFLNSKAWRVTRTALMLTVGGMCAALVLFLKDRNWVLELPWRPAPVETMVDLPANARPPVRTRELSPDNPFVPEDPSELEGRAAHAPLMPLPEATSVPVGASPISSGKK